MKKKLISAILCAALAAASIASVSAADTASSASAEPDYRILGTIELNNYFAGFYRSVDNILSGANVSFYELGTDNTELIYEQSFDSIPNDTISYKRLSKEDGYGFRINGGGNIHDTINFKSTGGTYEKVRLKLCDFDGYFNEDGTITPNLRCECGSLSFNFTDEGNKCSWLAFYSGGVFSMVAPDKNGYIELYLSTDFAEETYYRCGYWHSIGSHSSGSGCGTTLFRGFTIGDVNKEGNINLADAILTQKASLGTEKLDSLSTRNADTNRDGLVNLRDAIKIQKYSVGIK